MGMIDKIIAEYRKTAGDNEEAFFDRYFDSSPEESTIVEYYSPNTNGNETMEGWDENKVRDVIINQRILRKRPQSPKY
jgi:hypothetical protein